MSSDDAKSLSQLIGTAGTGLGDLDARARLRSGLGDHLRNALGEPLGSSISHCNIREDGTLVISAASPEWAARLRFEQQRLLELAREFGTAATAVKVRVAG